MIYNIYKYWSKTYLKTGVELALVMEDLNLLKNIILTKSFAKWQISEVKVFHHLLLQDSKMKKSAFFIINAIFTTIFTAQTLITAYSFPGINFHTITACLSTDNTKLNIFIF